MAQIICRHADNDFEALRTAQGMENAGANVFNISYAGMPQRGARYIVWAKYDGAVTPDLIDTCIEKAMEL